MARKLTQKIVKERCEKIGILLAGEYVTMYHKTDFICPSCSNIFTCLPHNILSSHTKSCGCQNHPKKDQSCSWTGIGSFSGFMFARYKISAKKRRLDFCITKGDVWEKYLSQEKKCFYSNEFIDFNVDASIDRINNNIGYHKDNIVICHKIINRMKLSFSLEYFTKLCSLVLNKNNVENLDFNMIKTKRNSRWSGIGNISKTYFTSCQSNAYSRDIEFNLNLDYLWQLYISQLGKCKLSGLPISFDDKQTASLDRIDSSNGYISGNVQWVHKDINLMKWDLQDNQLLYWCNLITNNKRIL